MWLALTMACQGDGPAVPPPPRAEPIALSPVERAVRVSMALRGVRPAWDELDRVEADPDALPELVEVWLEDPAFGETVRDLWNEALQMRADTEPIDATGPLSGYTLVDVRGSIQEATLRSVERIVTEDRPYTELVTGATADADEIVARAWAGLAPYDPDGPEWQALPWVDGRPAAGILADSALWLRWRSAGSNAQRGRANLVARALLCEDFLERDATIDTSSVADPTGGSTSLASPGCAVCHHTLDPLASFFPFVEYPGVVFLEFPVDLYDETWVEREGWTATTGLHPDYYGLGGETLADLAARIAEDPRLPRCVASRWWAFLHQRELRDVPTGTLDALQAELLERGSMRDLARALVLDPAFATTDGAGEALRVRSEALPRLVEDLTGFRWWTDGDAMCCATENALLGDVDLATDGYRGWVMLWGGIDGPYAARPSHASSTTSTLVLEETAALAASAVVASDLAEPEPDARRLLRWVEADTTDEASLRHQLARLHLRVLGEAVADDDPEVDETLALLDAALAASGDPARAWSVVLAAMLSDDRMEYY